MPTAKIIFVGQQDIADELNLSFGADRSRWSACFAATGGEALSQLRTTECDVVVTELALPDMAAIDLLRQVQEEFPKAARLVLSAAGDPQSMMRSLAVAHQILRKPCSPEMLEKQVANSLAMRTILNDDNLHARIAKIDKLPVLPSIYKQLVEEMQSETASVQKIAELIRRDVAITARVLQMINSAHFGVSRHVDSALQAVNLLGLDNVKSLVLTAGVFSQFKESGLAGFLLDEIYGHSLTVGTSAQYFANAFGLGRQQAEEALTAGTLHDIGKLILVTNFEKEAKEIVKTVKEQDLPLHTAERQMLGVSHCEIGAHLLSLWGLSDHVLEAVAFHDAPETSAHPTLNVLAAVHLANAFDHDQRIPNREPKFTTANVDYLNQIGLGSQLTQLRALSQTQQAMQADKDSE
jgi:putative nucleotidyltransferase with HDIG domain